MLFEYYLIINTLLSLLKLELLGAVYFSNAKFTIKFI